MFWVCEKNLRKLPYSFLYLRLHICQMRKLILISLYRDIVRLKEIDVHTGAPKIVWRIYSFLSCQILSPTFVRSRHRSQQLHEAIIPICETRIGTQRDIIAKMSDDPLPCSFRGSWAWSNNWTYTIIYITVQQRIWRWKTKGGVYPKEHQDQQLMEAAGMQDACCRLFYSLRR